MKVNFVACTFGFSSLFQRLSYFYRLYFHNNVKWFFRTCIFRLFEELSLVPSFYNLWEETQDLPFYLTVAISRAPSGIPCVVHCVAVWVVTGEWGAVELHLREIQTAQLKWEVKGEFTNNKTELWSRLAMSPGGIAVLPETKRCDDDIKDRQRNKETVLLFFLENWNQDGLMRTDYLVKMSWSDLKLSCCWTWSQLWRRKKRVVNYTSALV